MDKAWFEDVTRRIANLEMQNAVDEVHHENVTDRLSAIEDTLKWLVRLIIGGFVMGALSYALRGGFQI
ncbi:hemolysin XhlA family protein [Loktanella sp. S4079]|uniref:hemolysin XhlA family protein n=1 Tax=Loktanella sp. S4079 TaxID=579483 RepID=UPI0005F9FCD9|nr:hemolysin XhlA family protein [Loktanella sp. S4079]KJZ19964.1 pseudouridine synthase [Loktanella sp. S4079]